MGNLDTLFFHTDQKTRLYSPSGLHLRLDNSGQHGVPYTWIPRGQMASRAHCLVD